MSTLSVAPAKIVKQSTHQVAGKILITEHFFEVPKNHAKPEQGNIRIFARSARKHETVITPDLSKAKDQLPWIVYLQGGPGLECRSPHTYPWTSKFLDAGYQMIFMDPRGTGLSTPVTTSALQKIGSSRDQADYLKHFRADSIVRDAEAIRQALTSDYPAENRRWSTVGQSFGGFCTLTYLSFFPDSLRECFVFGGLAPIVNSPDDVYRRLFVKVKERNEAFYAKYPDDVDRVKTILKYLADVGDGSVVLPSGGHLTRRRFLQLGINFGFHGGIDSIHDLVLRATNDLELFGELSRGTLSSLDNAGAFDNNLIYAILHEPIYCQGHAPAWAAERQQKENPEFNVDRADGPVYFTGEMIFSHMFEDYVELRKIRDAAELLAKDTEWPALYDEEQLAKNKVPVYAASYIHDMYVDQDLAMETAKKVKGTKVFVTNLMFHDAIRSKMDEVVGKLFLLRDDLVD